MKILRRRTWALAALVTISLVNPVPARAQAVEAPDSFSINAAATGILLEVSAPAALPLDVLAGISHAQVGVNSQPRIQSTAAPVFVPLLQDLGLLGGTAGVLGIVAKLAPGLIVGLPTIVGLQPLPIDPSLVPVDPLADLLTGLPVPPPPPLGCTANFPDVPSEVECGGGAQDFFGFRVSAASARSVAEGELGAPASLGSRSDANVVGVEPSGGQPLAPFAAAAVAATADGRIREGRAVATASAKVGGIDLAGLFTVDSVQARYAGALGGTPETRDESIGCDIVGARLAGQPITLDSEAITIGGEQSAAPIGQLIAGLDGLLGSLGGQVGAVDFGTITITPNPAPLVELSEDGTTVNRRFGCLEIRYRIPASGTDVRVTLGNIAVGVNAFADSPPSSGGAGLGAGGDPASASGGELGGAVDSGTSVDLGGVPAVDAGFSLPDPPEAGGEAPAVSERPFQTAVDVAGWGIDGGWLAPFSLLALSLPLLARARTMAPRARPSTPR